MSENRVEDVLVGERNIGYLDPGIDNLLIKLNNKLIKTTSTCTGRITVVEGEHPWERGSDGSRILYKTHIKLNKYVLIEKIKSPPCFLWLRVSGPILHMRVASLECALYLIKNSRKYGFKHSGIISLSNDEYVVELMSGSQLMIPLKLYCNTIIDLNKIDLIVNYSNKLLKENKRKLLNLIKFIINNINSCNT